MALKTLPRPTNHSTLAPRSLANSIRTLETVSGITYGFLTPSVQCTSHLGTGDAWAQTANAYSVHTRVCISDNGLRQLRNYAVVHETRLRRYSMQVVVVPGDEVRQHATWSLDGSEYRAWSQQTVQTKGNRTRILFL